MTTKEAKKLEALKTIVKEHQATKIEGQLVDATTASLLVKVYEALNPTNQAKFIGLPVTKMAQVAWKLV